jgi:hypothetical protein
MQYLGPFPWGYNQEVFLVSDQGTVAVCLFCQVESGKLSLPEDAHRQSH